MPTKKPLSKMTKKELLEEIAEHERIDKEHLRATTVWENERRTHDRKYQGLIDDKHKAIAAVDIWKSACIEARERVNAVEDRMMILREIVQEAITNTTNRPEEEQRTILQKLWTRLAHKMVAMESVIKPFFHDYLPVPDIVQEIEKAKEKRELARKAAKGDYAASGRVYADALHRMMTDTQL